MSDINPVFENIKLSFDTPLKFVLAEMDAFPGMDIDMHFHVMHELMWFRESDGSFSINNHTFPLKNNTLVFLPSFLIHDMKMNAVSHNKHFLVQFEDEFLNHIDLKLLPEMRVNPLFMTLDEPEASHLDSLLTWANLQLDQDFDLFKMMVKNVLLFLISKFKNIEFDANQIIAHTHVQTIIKLVQEIDLNKNYQITTTEAADFCGWSNSFFSRTFKNLFGITFKDFILNRKLSLSVHLLTSTNQSIAEIAYQSGFTDSAYFCLKFKSTLGISPKRFRTRIINFEHYDINLMRAQVDESQSTHHS